MKLRASLAFAALAIPAIAFADTAPAAETADAPAVAVVAETSAANAISAANAHIAKLGDTIREKVSERNATKSKLDFAADNPEFTSPEVEAKRKEIRDLQSAILKAQIELREEVNKIPAVKELADANEVLTKEIDALRTEQKELIISFRKAQVDEMNKPRESN